MVPHVLFMFLAVLFGFHVSLAALLRPDGLLRKALFAFGSMTIGGMILGPLVQKAAFGEYWTGFPYGHDLTDNKTLVMWLLWLAAVLVLRFLPERRAGLRRGVTLAAAVVMIAVYLVPHSAYGSELDWSAGAPPPVSAPK